MQPVKARAIVLREYEAGESDKRLLLLCKEHGRILAYARGARKPKSKFMAAAQIFTYADFVLTKGQGFYAVSQADIIESFYPLRQDYDRLMTAYAIIETCEKTLWDNINYDQLLLLVLKSLQNLSKAKLPAEQIRCVFMHRFFAFHGIQPKLDACITCNTNANEMHNNIFLCAEGIVCKNHKPPNSHQISAATLAALKFIQETSTSQAFQFTTNAAVLVELNQSANLIWDSHFK